MLIALFTQNVLADKWNLKATTSKKYMIHLMFVIRSQSFVSLNRFFIKKQKEIPIEKKN